MGRVPMPVWAEKLTLKAWPSPRASVMSMVVLKSRPMPPNSSGTLVPRRPSSPDISISFSIRPSSWLSMASSWLWTFWAMKSSVIFFIISCSSFHSSGMKMSLAAVLRMSHSPPVMALPAWLSGFCVMTV